MDNRGFFLVVMGFDFSIQTLPLSICTETGKPFIYRFLNGDCKKIYIEEFVVPEEHRRFTFLCGRVYHIYTRDVSSEDSYSCGIQELLNVFPSWDDVKDETLVVSWGLTEEEHNGFYAALTWFAEESDVFIARWSY